MNTEIEKKRNENSKKFYEGQIVKNYKEFCEIFEEEVAAGNTKKSQIQDWLRYLDYEKIEGTQSYKIKEIYDKPKLKESTSKGLYVKFIEILLMSELAKRSKKECKNDYINLQIETEDGGDKDSHICLFSKTQLYHLLGMVNDNYLYKNRENVKENIIENGIKSSTGLQLRISEWDINHFIDRTTLKLNEILTSALKSMQRRSLIDCKDIMIIVEASEESSSDTEKYRVATTEEREYVLQVQKRVLKEMGLETIPFYNAQIFYEKVNKTMYKEKKWKRVYKEYEIVYLEKYIISDIPIVERELERYIKKNKIELNSKVLEALSNQSKTMKLTNEKKIKEITKQRKDETEEIIQQKKKDGGIGKIRIQEAEITTKKIKEFGDNYLENQEKLAEIFIKLGEL